MATLRYLWARERLLCIALVTVFISAVAYMVERIAYLLR